jgi:hypothetical protein
MIGTAFEEGRLRFPLGAVFASKLTDSSMMLSPPNRTDFLLEGVWGDCAGRSGVPFGVGEDLDS